MARGLFGQMIQANLETGLVIASLSTWPNCLIIDLTRDSPAAFCAILEYLP